MENDPVMKMSKLFSYEEPESSVRYRRFRLQFIVYLRKVVVNEKDNNY